MQKKAFLVIIAALLFIAVSGILIFVSNDKANRKTDEFLQTQDITVNENESDGEITEISVDSVKGITQQEAEELCYFILGDKDDATGFTFSFGVLGAVKTNKKQYYVIRASWLVNNSHLSYIGDFFVSADGKEVYSGTALEGEYIMESIIWKE